MPSMCDNQKCLQIVANVLQGAKLSMVENDSFRATLDRQIQVTLLTVSFQLCIFSFVIEPTPSASNKLNSDYICNIYIYTHIHPYIHLYHIIYTHIYTYTPIYMCIYSYIQMYVYIYRERERD